MHSTLDQGNLIPLLGFVAAAMMIRAGVIKKMLEYRRSPRVCAACGRAYSTRRCPACDGAGA